MQEIIFATSSKGKVESLANRLPKDKFVITPIKIDLVEVQGDTAEEISKLKAKFAFEKIQKPLIVQDSALHIPSLNGFPGPYIKYIQDTIGPEGLLKLVEGHDRTCYFETALTYIDSNTIKTFVKQSKHGRLADKIDITPSEKAWGITWNIYIPHGQTKTLSAMTKEEINAKESKQDDTSEFAQFAKWILQQ